MLPNNKIETNVEAYPGMTISFPNAKKISVTAYKNVLIEPINPRNVAILNGLIEKEVNP